MVEYEYKLADIATHKNRSYEAGHVINVIGWRDREEVDRLFDAHVRDQIEHSGKKGFGGIDSLEGQYALAILEIRAVEICNCCGQELKDG